MNPKQSRQPTHATQPELDIFQQLFNDGQFGQKGAIRDEFKSVTHIPAVRIRLNPDHYRNSLMVPSSTLTPCDFYEKVVKNWLDQHPLLAKAEARDLGDAIDVILWLDSPIAISGKRQRYAWAGLIKVVQSILPINPQHPSMNATTRATGSVIGSTGHKVSLIRQGEPLTKNELSGLYVRMAVRPFDMVMRVVTSQDRLDPCPLCKANGSSLVARRDHGFCDGGCGEVTLAQLYDLIFNSPEGPEGTRKLHTNSETNAMNPSMMGAQLAARFEKARQRVREYWPTSAKPPRREGTRDSRLKATLEGGSSSN